MIQNYLALFLKGMAMGAANVVPGVSGGTIAFITGIYNRFINALKSFDLEAIKKLLSFKIKEFLLHIDAAFLIPLILGVGISLVTIGKLLDHLFESHPILVWSYFFGLILASVYSLGKEVKKWNVITCLWGVIGVTTAVILGLLKPASESDALIYLLICGVAAMSSMILPGLSGSFVLILLGNYQLIMLKAIPNMDIKIIIPVALGAIIGFIVLSRAISFLLKKAESHTMMTLTGFILGSLFIIWPWKKASFLKDDSGAFLLKKGEKIVESYQRYSPSFSDSSTFIAIALMILGFMTVFAIDRLAKKSKT